MALAFSASDHEFMARALRLAERSLYTTTPNPRVGCVVVRSGQVVGEGWHVYAGGQHAEIHALQAAGEKAHGATVFVTLEPCSHHGRTPPCAVGAADGRGITSRHRHAGSQSAGSGAGTGPLAPGWGACRVWIAGCRGEGNQSGLVVVNNAQDLPDLTTLVTASTNCAVGKEDGTASVVTVDGTAVGVATGYTYAWTGPVAPPFVVTNPVNNANTAQLIKEQGGVGYDYTVLVTNQANGCQTSLPLIVPDAKVLPVIALTPTDNGICNPGLTVPAVQFSGAVTATVTNQVGALTDYSFAFGAGMHAGVTTLNV